MELQELEEPIQSIITLVEKLEDKYQEKCFEILLNFYLKTEFKLSPISPEFETEQNETESTNEKKYVVPIDVRAFLSQHGIAEEMLEKLFFIENDDIIPIYEIKTTRKSIAQIQTAMLFALEKAIKGGKFEFSKELVRERCKEKRIYAGNNFNANFKNNERYFNDLEDDEHIELSPDGRTELAEVIVTVAKQ